MQTSRILRRPLSALLPLVFLLLASTIVGSAQTVINSLPYTISAAGDYVLGSNLNSSQTSGALITVNASNVTIDLQGHYLLGPASYSNQVVYGVYATERANVTIRNGTISQCFYGVFLTGNGNASTTNNLNQAVDNLRVSHAAVGIYLNNAPASTLTNCKLSQITLYGILVGGAGVTVQGCVFSQIGTGGIVLDTGSFAHQNTVSNAYYGIYGGKYQDNLTYGCTTSFAGGTDAGGNN